VGAPGLLARRARGAALILAMQLRAPASGGSSAGRGCKLAPLMGTSSGDGPVRIGVVGLGYWGPNLARNFDALPGCELAWVCDGSIERLNAFRGRFPHARETTELDELLADPDLEAVAIATPVPTHATLACRVLEAGKHAFVEKPLAQSVDDAEEVVAAARFSGRTLMVGHLLEYHPGLERLKELVDSGELGKVHYIYGNRLNLGKLRADENALWSLGAHDVSVLLWLTQEDPIECHAHGESYMRDGIEDVVFCYLRFPSGLAAHLHLSWLDPHKERRFTVVGSKRMATFDDMAVEQKLTVYDKGVDQQGFRGYGEYIARSGDVWSPQVPNDEPLRLECHHFIEQVINGARPRSDGLAGLRVVRVLEALQESLDASSVMRANAMATSLTGPHL
jgi:predicted dehydrogenase